MLAVEADGQAITTVEGLPTLAKVLKPSQGSGNELHPIQKAFVAHGGVQCGFCTPGILLSSAALLAHNPHPTENEIRDALAGNLCRCTGYDKIVRAVQAAAEEMHNG